MSLKSQSQWVVLPRREFEFSRLFLPSVSVELIWQWFLFLVCSGLKHGVLVWDLRISRIEDSVEEGFLWVKRWWVSLGSLNHGVMISQTWMASSRLPPPVRSQSTCCSLFILIPGLVMLFTVVRPGGFTLPHWSSQPCPHLCKRSLMKLP